MTVKIVVPVAERRAFCGCIAGMVPVWREERMMSPAGGGAARRVPRLPRPRACGGAS
jgi:hypothetical protein